MPTTTQWGVGTASEYAGVTACVNMGRSPGYSSQKEGNVKICIENLPKLTEDLRAAYKAAKKAVGKMKDGGSCNSDAVGFPFDRLPHPNKRMVIDKAFEAAGIHSYWSKKYGQNLIRASGSFGGQGGRNYKGIQVMADHLKKAGWDVFVDYVVD